MPDDTVSAALNAIAGSIRKDKKQPPAYADDEQMWRTLQHHKNLDFVRRLLNPDMYPAITSDPRLPPGYHATHQMSSGDNIAWPNIFFDRPSGTLQWPTPEQALAQALTSGEYITFPSDARALQFGAKYKRGASRGRR